jgi:tetratricopeptide (TPR) repeat protein
MPSETGRIVPGRSRRRLVAALVLVALVGGTAAAVIGQRRAEARRLREAVAEAQANLVAGRFATALRRLREAEARGPLSGEAHYLVGLCELGLNRPRRAEAAWEKIAPDDAPHHGLAALQWAEGERERGRLAAAEDRLRAALARPGAHRPRVRWALVQLLSLEGRHAEARRLFAAGLAEHPDPVEALRVLYKLEVEPFPAEATRAFLAEAARLAPDDDRVWLARAHLALHERDLDASRAELDRCLRSRPDDPAAWRLQLEWAREADRPDAAADALGHLSARDLDPGELVILRAWAARRRGDPEAERRALEALDPPASGTLERLAELAIAAGKPDEGATLRARRRERERTLQAYLGRIGGDVPAGAAPELARLAAAAGRPIDAAYWRARAEGRAFVPDDLAGARRDALPPDLLAALRAQAPERREEAAPASRVRFRDDAARAGLDFVHRSGAVGGRLIPTVTASGGVALLDYDRDGALDVFAVQSGTFPPSAASEADGDRLFRNRGDGSFEDATERAGLGGSVGYGHGVAVGDIDGDGFPDLFVTRWRSYALHRNRGDGTFEDVTAAWGLVGDRDWPTSAAFADLDGDGDLDLYVCHYLAWDEHDPRTCADPTDPTRYACSPLHFAALPDHLFRNDGGRFVDATAEAGLDDRDGRSLGVVAADLDDDGRTDLFVANDMTANRLYLNRGGLRFEERGHESGVASNGEGGYQAGMGVTCGDLDGDGRIDLAVTNFYGESTTFFRNLGGGLFADASAGAGIRAASRSLLGFGLAAFDADNDGRLDLLSANGHVHDGRPVYPWRMPMQLLVGGPSARFADASRAAGEPFEKAHIARGLAVGDLDGDGRLDAVVQCQDEPLIYLHNTTDAGHWLALDLEGTASNRDAVGAVVAVRTPDGGQHVATRYGGGSYQSASSPRIHVGLGAAARVDGVEVRWPSGRVDRFDGPAVDRAYSLREGDDRPRPLPVPSPSGPFQQSEVTR